MRDIYDDVRAGYRTFAGILGPELSKYYYALLILSAYILVPVLDSIQDLAHMVFGGLYNPTSGP